MKLFLKIILNYNQNWLYYYTLNISSVINIITMNNNNNLIK